MEPPMWQETVMSERKRFPNWYPSWLVAWNPEAAPELREESTEEEKQQDALIEAALNDLEQAQKRTEES
jgi:hypothetical protein